jgi:5'-nucleotidase
MHRIVVSVAVLAVVSLGVAPRAEGDLMLSVFHNNDGESQLLPTTVATPGGDVEVGGLGRFVSRLDQERAAAASAGRQLLTVSAGDNFLAGPVFSVSQTPGQDFFDALAMNAIGYNAITLGNHEFDFGPDTLVDFISEVDASIPFLSANLQVSDDSPLKPLVDAGRIRPSTVVTLGNGEEVGLIGLTTPDLGIVSNPGDTVSVIGAGEPTRADQLQALADVVNTEVAGLQGQGVDRILLVSHLQSIQNEIDLAPLLNGVDAIVGGGGDELLAGPTDPLLPGDTATRPYPVTTTRMDGATVPVVTTSGKYGYFGRLDLDFDAAGELPDANAFGGSIVRVAGSGIGPDGVAPDANVQNTIIMPLEAALDAAQTVVATSEVELDGIRPNVRTRETNFGNLIADSFLDAAQETSPAVFGNTPTIAITNGGGIRNSVVIPEGGEITALTAATVLPFENEVVIVEDVTPDQLLFALERAVSAVELVAGQFAQVSGFSFSFDPNQPAQELAFNQDGEIVGVVSPGERIVDVMLDMPGGPLTIIEDGEVIPEFTSLTLDVATLSFLAGGGDGYPWEFFGNNVVDTGVLDRDALTSFLADDLGGVVPASLYAASNSTSDPRITIIPEPASLALVGLGALCMIRRRRAA